MLKKLIIPFFIIFLSTFILNSFAYYSPGRPDGFVNDYTSTLTTEQEVKLETVLKEFKNKNGGEIAVVIVKSFKGDTKENFAVKLFEEWGIGDKKDRGVLILISKEDRQIRVEVGYGFEGDLPDAFIFRDVLNKNTLGFFTNDQYYAGISNSISTIFQKLNFTPSTDFVDNSTSPSSEFNPEDIPWWMWAFFISLFGIIVFLVFKYGPKTKYDTYGYTDRDSYWDNSSSDHDSFGGGRSGGGGSGASF